MKLFGTDGVRGEAGVKLSAMSALKLGISAGIFFRKHSVTNKILVGKDTRKSGYMIENALVSGLTAVGYNVIQIGPMPTPAVAFLTEDMRCDAGIMISASHNPFADNGIKFFNPSGFKLDEKSEASIENIYFGDDTDSHLKKGHEIGSSKRIDDVIGRYIVHIKNSFPKDLNLKSLRICVDAANGAAYKVAPTIFSELGADVIVLNDEPNGTNINENCGATDPVMLCEAVKKYRADLGIALDGDADRLVLVDENGEVIDGDVLIGALAYSMKKEGKLKNNAVVATVMSNKAMEDFLRKEGIKLYRANVGDKYVLEEMQRVGAVFGGEQSGHIIFSEFAKTGDGILSALQALSFILRSGKKCSEAFNLFTLCPQLLKNINISKKIPLEEIEGMDKLLKEVESKGIRQLIRYSGTENKLRILLEGDNASLLEQYEEKLEDFFKKKLA